MYAHSGEILAEVVTFHSNGKSHKHKEWELCTVIKGEGRIITTRGEDVINKVNKGSVVQIPPGTHHWMEVDEGKELVIMIVYVKRD